MRELIYFRQSYCPYCKQANNYLDELKKENPKYCRIPINIIDEAKKPRIAKQYDYWYVPCFFMDNTKLHEGVATKENIRAVLDKALE